MSIIVEFLKGTLEDIKPKLALGSNNPNIDFLDLTVGEFEKFRFAIYQKYNVIIRIQHMFNCLDLGELSKVIEILPKVNVYCEGIGK